MLMVICSILKYSYKCRNLSLKDVGFVLPVAGKPKSERDYGSMLSPIMFSQMVMSVHYVPNFVPPKMPSKYIRLDIIRKVAFKMPMSDLFKK